MPKTHDNSGAVRIVQAMREQSKKVYEANRRLNMLGTITSSGVYLDAVDDVVPMSDFLFLQADLVNTGSDSACMVRRPQPGDRVLCLPVGDYFVILGKVE